MTLSRIVWSAGSLGALLAAPAPDARAQEPHSLIGRWETPPTSPVAIGQMLEIRADGVVLCTPGSLVQGSFRSLGANLVQAANSPPDTVTVRVVVRSDTMIQYSTRNADSALFFRSNESRPASGVIGSWRTRSPTGKVAFVDYRPDSSFRLWIPFDTDTASHRVSRDTLDVRGGCLDGRHRWSMNGELLQLMPLSGDSAAVLFFIRRRN